MTPAEASALLTIAAGFDNRKPDPDVAKAWSMALDGFTFVDCRDAIVSHYKATTDWLMPAHIITLVKRVRSKRIAEETWTPPPGLDPDRTADYAGWLVKCREAAANGESPPPEPPAAVRGRDVLAELGMAGRSLDPEPAKSAREVFARSRAEQQAAQAAHRADRQAHDAEMAAARDADRVARRVEGGCGVSERVAETTALPCCNYIETADLDGHPCDGTMQRGWPEYECDTCLARCGVLAHPTHSIPPTPPTTQSRTPAGSTEETPS